jgi:spore coat protein H
MERNAFSLSLQTTQIAYLSKMIRAVLFFLFTLFISQFKAQEPIPAYGSAFRQDIVANIRISIHPDTLALVLHQDNWGNDREFPATFTYQVGASSQTVQNIGFRLRGNTSIAAQKKPFKVSFNTYVKGAKWNGLEKLNLNAHHNDPVHYRAKLCWDLLRECELTASRTSFVRLYINDEYKGIYTNVEHIDEEFVKLHINGIGRGNLYKCLYPAPLTFINYNPDSYKLVANNRRVYEQKINDFADDYRDIAEFIRVLNLSPIDNLKCDLEAIFNVDRYLRYAAMDVLLGNWDGYIFNNNNFYLYKNEKTGLFEYIPYDLDNTFGIDWFNIDWTERNIYNWPASNAQRPLYKRLMEIPEYRQRFSNYMSTYMNTVFTVENITNKVNQYVSLIDDAVQDDVYRTLDYGFSYNSFIQGSTSAFGAHVKKGIIPFTQQRINNALNQLDDISNNAAIQGIWIDHDFPVTQGGSIKAMIYDAENLPTWEWSLDGNSWNNAGPLKDDGIFPDQVANDHNYTANLPVFPGVDKVYYRVKLNQHNENLTMPCNGRILHLSKSNIPLYINELMASNSTTIANEKGEYSDWIELWNGSNNSINLKDYYLTDNPVRTQKFPLPDMILEAGAFILFWADNDEDFARNHTNFALSNSGEDLRLYHRESNEMRLVDRINFPAQNSNISYGRQSDGASQWVFFNDPTPGASNQTTSIENIDESAFYIFPNPAKDQVYFKNTVNEIILRDIQGRVLLRSIKTNTLNLNDLSNGIYLLELDGKIERLVIQK